jgi:hypothetical protein
MKVVIRKQYYLENDDKKKIKMWLITEGMTLVGLADKLDVSLSMLASMLNGNRAITQDNINKFKIMGLDLLGE